MPIRLRHALRNNEPVLGTVVTISSTVIAEIMAMAGWDYVWFDLEHTPMELESLQSMLQACHGYDVATIVRVPGNDEVLIKRVLDLGPDGIIVPLVNSGEEAAQAVRYMRYPPEGIRGAGIGRAQGFGESYSGNYFEQANDNLAFIAQVEHIDAVNSIEAILAVDGVDGIFLGPLDMSGSMGLLGQTSHPDVEAAEAKVLAACQKAGRSCGIMTMSPEQATARFEQGYTNVGLGIDVDTMLRVSGEWVRGVAKPA
ncbi:MAG: aldolase/citrate lyase family protein [Pseudomonadota bacterium]